VAHGAGTVNSHERDAYCAAVFAYRAYANKLRQIDALAELTHHERDRIKHLLLRGYRVQDAFMLLREPEKAEEAPLQKPSSMAKTATPAELRGRLEALARENANLRLALERLEEEKAALAHNLRLMENGARQSYLRDSEFRKLRFQLQSALNRLSWKGKKKRQEEAPKMIVPEKKERMEDQEDSEGINSLGEQGIDLERLVAEYRKGRKNI
jgi:predicted RNase H-like nuclease (RuvC/YqgF family)